MLVPVGDAVSIPVEVIFLTKTGPRTCYARLVRHGGDEVEVVLGPDDVTHARPGTRAMVDSGESSLIRMVGVVEAVNAGKAIIAIEKSIRRDLREYPRTYGGIHLRYRVLDASEVDFVVGPWMEGEDIESKRGVWRSPDPYMNFSATGLRFDEPEATCASGDVVLLEMEVPTSKVPWRAIAEVVRCSPLPEEERTPEATHFIALSFTEIPAQASQALARFTLRVLSALA
jgi:hypothetical protein